MSSHKRILVITELFLPTKGGTAVWFDEVYRRLGKKEIHIVTAAVPGDAEYDTQHANTIHRVLLQRHAWLRPESLMMYLKLFGKSFSLAMRFDFDAVHSGRVLPEGLIGLLVARLIRVPSVIYAHGEEITTWRKSAKFKMMCFVYRHADTVIANSNFTRDELLKLGVKSKNIALISPGVDIDRFQPGLESADLRARIDVSPSQKLILSVGRLSRRKGFDQVIKSLPSLIEKGLDVHYAIIGIGEDRQYLQEFIESNGMNGRVHFLGHVELADLPRWYNASDVFVMPNREINGDTEGFGMVFLEASACGKPVIAGKAGGTGAAVIDGETGLRIDGDNLEEVKKALVDLLTDNGLSRRLGERGYARAQAEYSWEKIAEKTVMLK